MSILDKLFGPERNFKGKELEIIEQLVIEIERQEEEISRLTALLPKPTKPHPVTFDVVFINNKNTKMGDILLAIANPKPGIFTITDNKTQLPVVAVFANQSVGANSNPAAATFAMDPANPNNAIGTGLAAGTGTIVFQTDATWTDPGDQSAQSLTAATVTKNFSVLPSADGGSFDVVFS